jgi:hypothetical protein
MGNLAAGNTSGLSAINTWTTKLNDDQAEGQLYALYKLANSTYGWRSNALKFIVWFGDNPGHNPICQGYTGNPNDPPVGFDLDTVADRLKAANITVLAISVYSGTAYDNNGLDYTAAGKGNSPCTEPSTQPKQATKLTNTTGGALYENITSNQIVQVIIDALYKATCPATVEP